MQDAHCHCNYVAVESSNADKGGVTLMLDDTMWTRLRRYQTLTFLLAAGLQLNECLTLSRVRTDHHTVAEPIPYQCSQEQGLPNVGS